MTENLTTHKIALAHELLDDIELSRLAPEQLLLKASRLARLVEAPEIQKWLQSELNGYPPGDPINPKYMDKTGRWTNKKAKRGYLLSLAELNGHITARQLELQRLQVPNIHFAPSSANPNEFVTGFGGLSTSNATTPVQNVLNRMQSLSAEIAQLSGIPSRIQSVLHDFVASTYYELAFSCLAETIFEKHKSAVDVHLREIAGDAFEKIPALYDRLAVGDREAVSQALNTCRRIINAFADAVYPPKDETITLNGTPYKVGAAQYLNRIYLYLHEHCPSESRRDRLNKTIRLVNDRTSAGVHTDITPNEAKSLFLQLYLTLGEILSAADGPINI